MGASKGDAFEAMSATVSTAWAPHPGPQTAFLQHNAAEILYGGAAGGGKSDALLIGALRQIHHPTYRGVLFRRTYPDLLDSLVDRSWSIYPACGGSYNKNEHTWTFPSGAKIRLRSMQHEEDRFKFKSVAFQYIGFDELTTFEECQYLYLFSRLRSAAGLPCVMRSGSNPGGVGHEWVLRRWAPWLYCDPNVDPERARPDEHAGPFMEDGVRLSYRLNEATQEFDLVPEGTPRGMSRTFIGATLKDNPSILVNDPEYLTRLEALDRVERARLKDADWMIRGEPGEWFDRSWFPIVPRGLGRTATARVRYWDRAGTAAPKKGKAKGPDWTVGMLLARDRHGFCYVEDVVRFRGPPHEVERRIVETTHRDRRDYGDVLTGLEKDPGQAGKFEVSHYIRKSLQGFNVRALPPQGDKITRAKPVSAQAEQGNIRIVRAPWNRVLLDELEQFPDGFKDQVDALSGGYAASLTSSAGVAKSGDEGEIANAGGGY